MTSTAEATTSAPDDSPLRVLIAGIERARKLTVWSLLALVLGTALAWAWSNEIFLWLARPLTDELAARGQDPRLTFTALTDPFILYFTVSLFGGLVFALPVLTAQLWIVVAPRAPRRPLLVVTTFVVAATGLFLAGTAFCYYVLIPFAVAYLLDVGQAFEQAVTVREFLRFTVRLMIALGFAAQLPLVTLVASRMGLVTARTLLRWFPYATLLSFIAAAWLTPPDGVSQLLVAVPLLGLYLLGAAVAAIAGR